MGLDRKLGKLLEGAPRLRKLMKYIYLRISYCFAKKQRCQGLKISSAVDGFFGYYDKSPWNPYSSRLLFHSIVDSSILALNVLDLDTGDLQRFGRTTAWNWQQGAMLQWVPRKNAVVYNDLVCGDLVTKIFDFKSKSESIVAMPIQTLHPDGNQALSLNYKRLHLLRPEYGYSADVNNFQPGQSLEQDGIWHFCLFGRNRSLIVSIEQLIHFQPRQEMHEANHKVNHVIYSPKGTRFVFVHRWIGSRGKFSRLYVANNPDGSNLRLLMDDRMVSHYCWRDEDHLLVYGRTLGEGDRYYLVNVTTGNIQVVGKDVLDQYGDGHPSYSPDGRYILTDTYPDKARMRHVLLYDTESDRLCRIASFFSPWKFDGANRVDFHPRWSPCGRYVSVDSAHEGRRKMYVLDVERVVK
jgi:hypothetical protein